MAHPTRLLFAALLVALAAPLAVCCFEIWITIGGLSSRCTGRTSPRKVRNNNPAASSPRSR
jgi:hypothetical protein